MASFIREVLSATGTLGENLNFPSKIGKIQKKLEDLKSSLLVHIDTKYTKFSSNIGNVNALTENLKDLSDEIETLHNSFNNHLKTQLGQYRDFRGIHVCGIVYHICSIVYHICGNFDPQMWYSIPHMWYTQK